MSTGFSPFFRFDILTGENEGAIIIFVMESVLGDRK
jgi:hypothetical protein